MEDDEKTPTSSPSDDQEQPVENEVEVADTDTEDAEAERTMKKSAEARIHELLSKNKDLEKKMQEIEAKMAPPPPPPAPAAEPTPEVKRAVDYLKTLGFTQKQDVEERLRQIEDRMVLNNEHQRLESTYSGADGRPKYDRAATEEFMRKRGIYDAEAAYKLMHEQELFDFELKRYEGDRKKKPFVQKPGSSSGTRGDNTITREKIAEWLKTPEGRTKYEQNREKILSMLAKGEL